MADALYASAQDGIPWPSEDPYRPQQSSTPAHINETPVAIPDSTTPVHNAATSTGTANNADAAINLVKLTTDDSEIYKSRGTSLKSDNHNTGSLFKAYRTENEKYSGSTDNNFDRKFVIFEERCDQMSLSEEDCHRAFSIMLFGNSKQFYFD